MNKINDEASANEVRNNLLTAAEDLTILLTICMDKTQQEPLNKAFISKVNDSIARLNRLALELPRIDKAA